MPEDDLLDLLDAAVRGGLLVEVASAPGRYSFVHALVRTTLEAELSATRRARLHLRIGEAIESSTAPGRNPGWRSSRVTSPPPGPQAADRAVAYALRAAEQAAGRLAYEEAARLLDAAAALRRSDAYADREELARLEIALAAAQSDAGQWEAARASYARAASAAREAGAADAFALAALGHAGGTWEQFGVADAENVNLIEEALRRLPAEDSPMRAQVLAKLAIHRCFEVDSPEAGVRAIADEAVAMARRVGEAQPLAAALTGALHARWRPGRAAERLPLAAELIELTEAHEKPKCAADAHIWRASALLELCRLDEADAHLARHAELAAAAQQPALQIHCDAVRTMRAGLEGDYERAARIARELYERGERDEAEGRLRSPIHAQIHGANLLLVLNERSELGPRIAFFERLAQQVAAPGWRPALAWAQAQAGRSELARELIEAMSADGFSAMPRDSNFIPRLAQLAHAIGELGDAELAARVEPLLAPYGGYWVVFGPSAACTLGPVAYSVGILQLLLDRPAEAAAAFELALERSRRCARGPTRRARRPGSRPRCARSARTSRAEDLAASCRRDRTRARHAAPAVGARGAEPAMTARIRLCGRLEVELGGERVEHRLPGRQGPLVVAVLAVNRERPVSRDELIGALWPDRPPADPDEALSALLSKVRQALGRDVLTGRRELTLALPADAEIDVEQAHAAAARARAALAAGDPADGVGGGVGGGRDRRPGLPARPRRPVGPRAPRGARGPAPARARGPGPGRARARRRARRRRGAGGRGAGARGAAARGGAPAADGGAGRARRGRRGAGRLRAAAGAAARRAGHGARRGGAGAARAAADRRGRAARRAAPRAPDRLPERLAQALRLAWVGRHAPLRGCASGPSAPPPGETELVLVTGEGGIGKTRLVAELAREPRLRRPLRALRRGGAVPFRPVDRHAAAASRTAAGRGARGARRGAPELAGCCRRSTTACPGSPRCRPPAIPRRSAASCSRPSWPSCAGSRRAGRC